jgi:hypothetical protein
VTSSLLVIVPTRGRPSNVARLEQARRDTQAVSSDFLYVVDDDDPQAMQYVRLGVTELAIIHRQRLGPTLNTISAHRGPGHDYLGFMGDDHLPRTPGWDEEIVKELDRGGPRVVYGNDLLQGANLPTAVFLPSRVVAALGFFCPPDQVHLYLDNFWLALGQALGTLVYRDDVIIEHIHPVAGKAAWDDRYAEVNAPALDVADRDAWLTFMRDGRFAAAVARVQEEYRS